MGRFLGGPLKKKSDLNNGVDICVIGYSSASTDRISADLADKQFAFVIPQTINHLRKTKSYWSIPAQII